MTEVESLLAQLVAIPSPNPPGDTREIAAFIAEYLGVEGASVKAVHPPEKPEAVSVIARVGRGSSPAILLHAHIDTVPIGADEERQWTGDPYRPRVSNGRMFGKGSVDDKAPLAAMMRVFRTLAQDPESLAGQLVIVAAAEEEVGGQLGTRWLSDHAHIPPADFVIVGEQTHNRAAVAHKGVVRAAVNVKGRSVHATNPDRGVNAVIAMAKILIALQGYHEGLAERVHPLVGVPTCNVGTIEGGSTANAVPDSCTIRLDRRMIPGEVPEQVEEELRQVVRGVDIGDAYATVDDILVSPWFESKLETNLGKAFLSAIEKVYADGAEPVGYLPGSDAKHLVEVARGGMVVFGPGSYEVAHGADEYVALDELADCDRILHDFLKCLTPTKSRG